jgi:hypothetical protein
VRRSEFIVFTSISRRLASGSTLRLTFPFGKTLACALAMLALAWGLAELGARTAWARAQFAFTSVGSPNPDFEQQVAALDDQSLVDGRVDCIVLGSSMVNNGFNPASFAAAYRQQAHSDLNCANFGISGIVTWQMADMARLVTDLYHPRLLILGTSARDFSDAIGNLSGTVGGDVMQTPWVRYRLGLGFSSQGWLVDHSYAVRNLLGLSRWAQTQGQSGPAFVPEPPIDLSQPPDRQTEAATYNLLAHYEMSAQNLAGLGQILGLKQQAVPVLVVEMPVHPTYVDFFGRGEQDQDLFRASVAQAAQAQAVPFLPADPSLPLPNSDWTNRNHLNPQGAEAFSAWLARQVALAAGAGQLDLAAH